MKRLSVLLVAAIVSVALIGCGETDQQNTSQQRQNDQPTQQESEWGGQTNPTQQSREQQGSPSEDSSMNQGDRQQNQRESEQSYDYQTSPSESGENE